MWKRLKTKKIFSHPRITLFEDTVELPSGHKIEYLHFGDQPDVVTMIARRRSKILLVREYTYPYDESIYQFPEGLMSKGESINAAANRELKEEAGYVARDTIKIGEFLVHHRRLRSKHNILVMENLKDDQKDPDIEEDIENYWFSEEEVEDLIRRGQFIQKNSLAAWAVFKAWDKTSR